jgi:hypothetical protein
VTSSSLIDMLKRGEGSEVLDALYDLAAGDVPPRIDDDELVYHLLRSPDLLIRERAVFLFGIKLKDARLCGEFLRQLSEEGLNDPPLISGLMLSIVSTGCRIDLARLKGALTGFLRNREIMRAIGMVVVGFIRLAASDMERAAFKSYLIAEGQPSAEEMNAAQKLLDTR